MVGEARGIGVEEKHDAVRVYNLYEAEEEIHEDEGSGIIFSFKWRACYYHLQVEIQGN